MSHDIEIEVMFNWKSFRKAFEEMGGSVVDGSETRGPQSSYKILDIQIGFLTGDLVITLTFDQKNFPRRSHVTHILHFPKRVAKLNEDLDTEKLRGVVLSIEKCEAKENDPHTLAGKYRIRIGDHLVRFQ